MTCNNLGITILLILNLIVTSCVYFEKIKSLKRSTIKEFKRKPNLVNAVRWNGLNISDIISFVGDKDYISRERNGVLSIYIQDPPLELGGGDWLVKEKDIFTVYSNPDFENNFTEK